MNPLRHQVPARSPLPFGAWVAGLAGAVVRFIPNVADPRDLLADELGEEYGSTRVLLLGSGTQALEVALRAARYLHEDTSPPVALPAYSCFDVAAAAIASHSPIRFYDLNPQTLAPNLESLERVFAQGARTLVIAPLFGIPVDWDRLQRCLDRWAPVVVEDAAQGYGAFWRGKPVGSMGELAVLSFGRGKGWTGGGGGALLANSDRAAEVLDSVLRSDAAPKAPGLTRSISSASVGLALWTLARPGVYRVPRSIPGLGLGETRYRPPEAIRWMPSFAAACARGSRQAAEKESTIRRANAVELSRMAGTLDGADIISGPGGGVAGYLRLPVRVPGGMGGFSDVERARRLGAEAGYPSILPALRAVADEVKPDDDGGASNGDGIWPGASSLVRELVTFPTHSLTTRAEGEELVSLLS